MGRSMLIVLLLVVLVAGCTSTPEPMRLVAEPPTAAATATPATALEATATVSAPAAAEQPYPAPEQPTAADDAAYPGMAATPAAATPQVQLPAAAVPQVIVSEPAAGKATVTGLILYSEDGADPAPLQYARVFLAGRLKDEAGQPSFMVSLSRASAPTTITDGEGRFAFGDVAPESYALIVEIGSQLLLAHDIETNQDIMLDAAADEITDIGQISISKTASGQ